MPLNYDGSNKTLQVDNIINEAGNASPTFPFGISNVNLNGVTDGSNALSGKIGEVLESTLGATGTAQITGSTSLGTFTDTTLTLVLTAGVWEVVSSGQIEINGATGSGATGVIAIYQLTDVSNNILHGARAGFVNGGSGTGMIYPTLIHYLNLTTSLSIKTRFCAIANSGGPTISSIFFTGVGTGSFHTRAFLRARRVR